MATKAEMEVHILNATPNAVRVCAATARQCMTPDSVANIIDKLTDEECDRILDHCIRAGHLAVLSSAHATVAVNVTRECLTQLNTHAWVKTVTQSQQYVDHRDFRYHVPAIFNVTQDEEQIDRYCDFMEQCQKEYNWHRDRTYKNLLSHGWSEKKAWGMAKQVARQVLPNAAEANTVLSGSFWAWYQWLQRRSCKRNTEFTLNVARTILQKFRAEWPEIFWRCGAPCEVGVCSELNPCGEPYKRVV